jgi:hypothetical protein
MPNARPIQPQRNFHERLARYTKVKSGSGRSKSAQSALVPPCLAIRQWSISAKATLMLLQDSAELSYLFVETLVPVSLLPTPRSLTRSLGAFLYDVAHKPQ